jgi:hypothetical protein
MRLLPYCSGWQPRSTAKLTHSRNLCGRAVVMPVVTGLAMGERPTLIHAAGLLAALPGTPENNTAARPAKRRTQSRAVVAGTSTRKAAGRTPDTPSDTRSSSAKSSTRRMTLSRV